MNYIVQPKKYHRGFCPTICKNKEEAVRQLVFWENHTDFEWELIEQ